MSLPKKLGKKRRNSAKKTKNVKKIFTPVIKVNAAQIGKPHQKKKKTEIAQIKCPVILVRSSALIVKKWAIMQTLV